MTFISTRNARGTLAWTDDVCRIAVSMTKPTFKDLKSMAVGNNRSISAEIRTMVEAAVKASKAKGA